MTLELDRLNSGYTRVVVGVLIQQRSGHKSFVGVLNPGLRMREGYTVLAEDNFGGVLGPRPRPSASSYATPPESGPSIRGSTATTPTRPSSRASWARATTPETALSVGDA